MASLSVDEVNAKIVEMHQAHYASSPTGLVKREESPNGNTIYHLYSNGEITYQKGGWAYLQRSEFDMASAIVATKKSPFVFPKDMGELTYAILTGTEALEMRQLMKAALGL